MVARNKALNEEAMRGEGAGGAAVAGDEEALEEASRQKEEAEFE